MKRRAWKSDLSPTELYPRIYWGVPALGSRRKASGGSEFAVALPGTDLAWGLAEPQHRAFGVELHLLQHRFLIPLLSALIHHGLQDEEWSIF